MERERLSHDHLPSPEQMVYADNGLDYCRECFPRVQRITRIQSMGRRASDFHPAESKARQPFW